MNKILKLAFLLIFLVTLCSCKKFLTLENPNDGINPTTVSDFEQLLNTPAVAEPDYLLIDMFGDDAALFEEKSGSLLRANLWEKQVFSEGDEDPYYNDSYKWIMHMNLLIERMGNATAGSAERKAIAIAQARINRAYYYLQLVNIYGQGYEAATASTELGVPLVLKAFSREKLPRATVQQVYAQVLEDLSAALGTPELPDFGSDVLHPGRAAALALQARTYLYMGNYDSALAAANATLAIRSTLLDYNSASKSRTLLEQAQNPENLMAKIGSVRPPQEIYLDHSLTKLLGSNDLRRDYSNEPVKVKKISVVRYYTNKPPGSESKLYNFNYGLDVPEVMLIKAECLARNGEAANAIALLNQLRQNRIKTKAYVPLNENVDGAEALRLTLEERRKELYMHGGLRVFDIKRLKLAVTRADLKGETIASEPAGSTRLIMPFSAKTLALNPLLVQNER